MPDYIIKVSKDLDLYFRYSIIVDAPTHWGTREEISRHPEVTEDRLKRADEYGTSAIPMQGFGRYLDWSSDEIWVREGINDPSQPPNSLVGLVKREDFPAFLDSYDESNESFNPPPGMVQWEVMED